MSTIVVVKKNNEIVIGADTLVRFGSTKKKSGFTKNSSKITKIGDTYIASVGNSVIDLILKSYFSNLEELPLFDSVDNIFETACNLHVALKDEYFMNPTEDEYDEFESSQMECLIANEYGIFGMDAMRYVEEYTNYSSYGTGYKFALGAMKVAYEQDCSAEDIARLGLEAAAEFDVSTDGPFHIHNIIE